MNKYDTNRECVKCGCKNISDNLLLKGKYFYLLEGNTRHWMPAPQEMIERMCSNCGFIFYETPLDKED